MRDLMRHLTDCLESGRDALLCRVVSTRGSTPQKAGAAMLLEPGGRPDRHARRGLRRGRSQAARPPAWSGATASKLHSFVLNHDYAWADGLICGGKMVILAECPRGSSATWPTTGPIAELLDAGRGFTEAIVLDPASIWASRRSAIASSSTTTDRAFASLAGGDPPAAIADGVAPLDRRPRPSEEGGVAYLPTMPRIRLVVVGAGHVGQAVAELAARADFDVWVVDDRRQYANPERFPSAQSADRRPDGRGPPGPGDHAPHLCL